MGYLVGAGRGAAAAAQLRGDLLDTGRPLKIRGAQLGAGFVTNVFAKYGYTNPFAKPAAPAPAPAPLPAPIAKSPLAPFFPTPAPKPATPTAAPSSFTPTAPTPTPVSVDSGASIPTTNFTPAAAQGGSGPATAGIAAGILAPIFPAAAAAAAIAPAVANALDQQPTTQIKFSDSMLMPDVVPGPEVYNADGTPVTPAAKTAAAQKSFVDTIKNLPPAAKVGGAALLFFLFSRR